jgi:hypothetical protein
MAHIATKAKKTGYCSNGGGSTATQLYFYFLDGGNATRRWEHCYTIVFLFFGCKECYTIAMYRAAWLTLAVGRSLAHSQT